MLISCAFATSLETPAHVVHAERLGFHRAWLYDSPALYPDVWATLALAAVRTSRIGLGPGVLIPEFDFAGQQTDATGLQYLRARYYDPETGTFLSREPLATQPSCTLNQHVYGAASPVGFVDPSGRVPVESDPGQRGGRSDCTGLRTKITNTLSAIVDAAKTWFDNEYGTWDTEYGAQPGAKMTPESRARHYAEFDRLQSALDRQLDDYFAKGSSKQKNPCPPPGGGLWDRARAALTLPTAEYFRKSLDDAARHWQGSTSNPSGGWNWHWPKPPDLGNTAP